ncbi:MAG: ABC transporter permease [Alphaproteobacteria bacterium]|nr:ABC transporter permease [Alphaproteobacteria bacterium]
MLLQGAFGPGSLGYTLYYATNFVFTGLAAALAFQARLFNIGAEGQATLGGLGIALACLSLEAVLPGWLVALVAIAGAALFGAAWAVVPGWLQAYRGSHIVITTIMFNFLASGLMVWLLSGPMMRPGQGSPQTRLFDEAVRLPAVHDLVRALGFEAARSPLNLSFLFALIACAAVWVLIWRTKFGYALRAIGHSEEAARYAGIPVRRAVVAAMALSGALAGCMALNEVLGVQHKLVLNFSAGYGFTGIAVALMGRNHPLGILAAGLLFGALFQGGAELLMGRNHPLGILAAGLLFGALFQGGAELNFEFETITHELALVIQGLVILFSGALAYMFTPWLARLLLARSAAHA